MSNFSKLLCVLFIFILSFLSPQSAHPQSQADNEEDLAKWLKEKEREAAVDEALQDAGRAKDELRGKAQGIEEATEERPVEALPEYIPAYIEKPLPPPGPAYYTLNEKKRAVVAALNAAIAPVAVSGEYRMSAGVNTQDSFLLNADGDLQEKNWRYISGQDKENTFDPRIYDRLRVDIKTAQPEGLNFNTKIVLDPWSFVGTTSEVRATGSTGDAAEFELKYWSPTRKTINETTFTTTSGDPLTIPEIKVTGGNTSSTTITDRYINSSPESFLLSSYEVREKLFPFREFWVEYLQPQYSLQVFPLAYQDHALTTDDPLGLSNHHIYWEASPWLYEWRPGRYYPNAAVPSFRRGEWSDELASRVKDSDNTRLIFLRGLSFKGDLTDTTHLSTTVAAPINPWQEYHNLNSLPGAVRVKQEVGEALALGGTYVFRRAFDERRRDALNDTAGLDINYKLGTCKLFGEAAMSKSQLDMSPKTNEGATKKSGNALKVGISTDAKMPISGDLAFTYMDTGFEPGLSNYKNTRSDQFWGKHIYFQKIAPEFEAVKIGDGVDTGRKVINGSLRAKLFDERLDTFTALRNVHRSSGKYVETVFREEAAYKITDELTSKFLLRLQDLPRTKDGIDPLITSGSTGELLRNAAVADHREVSIGTYSGGLHYKYEDWLALEGIYERTNDYGTFPRGLLNEVDIETFRELGTTIRRRFPFLYGQGFFPLPPYPYYNIYKLRTYLTPFEKLKMKFEVVKNDFKYAGGIDDNINHFGWEWDYLFNDRMTFGFRYTLSRIKDVVRQNAGDGVHYDWHNNFYLSFDYKVDDDNTLSIQYGEFGIPSLAAGGYYSPVGWALPTLDTRHWLRLFWTGKF